MLKTDYDIPIFEDKDIADLNEYSNKMASALKVQLDKFGNPLIYKGEVATLEDLPSEAENGNIYSVINENKNYIFNGTEWVEYSPTINLTSLENKTKATKTTEISEELTITDSAEVGGRLDIKSGKSEQATRSGKNTIIDLYSKGNSTLNFNIDKNKITNNMIFSGIINLSSTGSIWIHTSAENFKLRYSNIEANTKFEYFLIFTDEQLEKIKNSTFIPRIQIYQDGMDFTNVSYKEIMLRDSGTTDKYEAYGASPSPDYPSRIRNVGDNVNLANVSDFTLKASSNTYAGALDYVNLTAGKTYIISYNVDTLVSTSTRNTPRLYDKTNSVEYLQSNLTNYNNTIGRKKWIFNCKATGNYQLDYWANGCSSEVKISKYKIEEVLGNIPTPYTPYDCGSAEFKVKNKNKFDKNTITEGKYIDDKGVIRTQETAMISDYIEIITNLDYYISGRTTWSSIGLYDKNKTFLERISTTQPNGITNVTNLECKYIRINASLIDKDILQFIEGSEVKPYVEHKEQIVSFPFSKGQVLHKGDYLASDGIHQKRKTLIITGNENWGTVEVKTNTALHYLQLSENVSQETDILLCNIVPYDNSVFSNDVLGGYINRSNNRIFLRETHLDNNSWKAYLQEQYANGTPVTIEYELAEEIVIPYTSEQKDARFKLQHLLMYEGYTHIVCIDEIKPDIQATYYFNNELNKSYGARFDKIEENIHEIDNKKIEIKTNEELATNEYIDGKQVFRKRFNTGQLPNSAKKGFNIYMNVNIVEIKGMAKNTQFQRPIPNKLVDIDIENGWINLTTSTDMSSYTAYIDIYYTKS